MASLISGYEYDIFISYRQKDNRGGQWVSEFVEYLKTEIESTFKEEISVYFDVNPHDGLLETHDVDASLKEKLKCLVFIPILSRTYCDPKSFAWENEFKAFIEVASKDQFGLKVRLPNGNVASRVLPVRIHDLDAADIKLCESVLGSVLRGVEFIYKEPGVNRSLTSKDKEKKNLNGTIYRNQINKVALAIKEIILGMQTDPGLPVKEKAQKSELFGEEDKVKKLKGKKKTVKLNKRKLQTGVTILALLIITAIFAWPGIFKQDAVEKLASSGEKIAVAVMPFQNMTNDTTFNYWQVSIQTNLISSLAEYRNELRVRNQDNINTLLRAQGNVELASISPATAGTVSKKLEADIFINGNIQKAGTRIRIGAQLTDTKTMEVLKSFEVNGPYNDSIVIAISDLLRKKVTDFLLISKLITENLVVQHLSASTNSPEALKYYIYGFNAIKKWDFPTAREWYLKALTIDSNYLDPMMMLSEVYIGMGNMEQCLQLVLKIHNKRDQWPPVSQLWANWIYATYFESPDEQIKYLRQLQQIDDQRMDVPLIIGGAYTTMKEYKKAIPEYEKALEIWRKLWSEYFPGNNAVYMELGSAYHKTGQYEKEKKLYKKAEQDCPNDPSINLRLAVISFVEKDSIAANRYIEKYKSILKSSSATEVDMAKGMAQMYSEAGTMDKAEEYYRKAISLEPENPVLLNGVAYFIRENNRDPDEFNSIIDKALSLAPNKYDYYDYLDTKGYGLYKFGKPREALEILQKVWDEAPFKLYSIKSHLEEVKKALL